MKILIADDLNYNRELLGFILTDHGHTYCEAANGQEAVNLFQEHLDIDLVLMDVGMPVLDGYGAAKQIKAIAKNRLIPIIFVTALDEDEVISSCIESGGDDFVPKPFNEKVLIAKLAAHERMLILHNELKASNDRLSYHGRVMEREHKIVETIFKNGLQRMERQCKNINFYMSPLSMFNGDLLLIDKSPLGGVYVLLGDFTGHGLSAAIGCLPVSDIFYAMTKKKASIGAIAREINNKLQGILPSTMFFCASILELDASGERITVWSGGMNDMFVVDEKGQLVRRIVSQHMPLGILAPNEFEDTTEIVAPVLGLRIVTYTDGIIEAFDPQGEMFGEEKLLDFISRNSGDNLSKIATEIEGFHNGAAQTDDISLVEIVGKPVVYSNKSENNITVPEKVCLPWSVEVKMTPEQMRDRHAVEQIVKLISSMENAGAHEDIIFTVFSELYNNSLEHGVLQLDSSLKTHDGGFERYYQLRNERLESLREGEILIRMRIIPGKHPKLKLELTDSGEGFEVSPPEQHGEDDLSYFRGVNLLSSLCEDIQYSNGGRTVAVTYSLH